VILILAAAAIALQQPSQDVVRLKSGAEVKCKITKLTAQTVVYTDAAGKTVTVKNEEVKDVVLGDLPPMLKRALDAVRDKNWTKAEPHLDEAQKALAAEKRRELHAPNLVYAWALLLEGKKDLDGALRKLKELRAEFGDCRIRPESWRKSMEIARAQGEASLMAVLTEMKAEPEPTGSEAELQMARMKYAKAAYEEAHAGFTKLAGGSTPNAGEAKIWVLRSLRSMGRTAELEAACAKFAGDRSVGGLFQAANAGIGQALLAKAGTDKMKIHDAYLAFAAAISIGPPHQAEQGEDYALAVIGAGQCCLRMAQAVTEPEAKEEYKRKAGQYWTEVARSYKGTDWAATAQKELAALQKQEP
jgi:hypothetical protein